MVAASAAKKETTGASLTTSFDGKQILIHQLSNTQLPIMLSGWKTIAQHLILEFIEAVNSLFPDGSSLLEFPAVLLTDNLHSPNGLHCQPGNMNLLSTWKRKILDLLLHPGEKRHSLVIRDQLSYPSLLGWLKLDQDVVLTTLSKVAAFTCAPGISEGKYGYLHFDGNAESPATFSC